MTAEGITITSPLRPADQTVAFPAPVDITYGPLAVNLTVSFHRVPRRRCSACGNRRVCYRVGLEELVTSPPMCAKCAGIR